MMDLVFCVRSSLSGLTRESSATMGSQEKLLSGSSDLRCAASEDDALECYND